MGAYKKLNKQDAYITTYTAHKSWAMFGSDFDSYGIQAFNSAQKYNPTLQTSGPLLAALDTSYTAQSLAQLYYPTRSAAGEIISHSFDYYYQSTLTLSGSRTYDKNRSTIPGDLKPYLISIPRNLYGVNIRPGSFNILIGAIGNAAAVVTGYIADGYVTNGGIGTNFDVNSTFKILDDGEGSIYVSGSNPKYIIGDIIYPHGMVVVTDDLYIDFFNAIQTPRKFFDTVTQTKYYASTIAWLTTEMSFDSSHPIYTHNYHCKIRESEYNLTYNPSALSSSIKTVYDSEGNLYSTSSNVSNGVLNSNLTGSLTGSVFQPYITTVGLYNDANQLIAVGKMAQPLPKSVNTEMTIIVKIDI